MDIILLCEVSESFTSTLLRIITIILFRVDGGNVAYRRLLPIFILFYQKYQLMKIFSCMKSTVAKLEMSRKEAEAVKALKSAMEKAQREGKAHEEYEIGMLLVEMLIYKVIVSLFPNLFID